MKKRNLSIQAAVAILLGAASVSSFAGVAQGLTISMATQAIISNTTQISAGSIAYSTAVPLPLGNAVVRVSLGGGAKFVAPAGTLAGSAGLVIAANTGASTLTITDGTVSADQTTITFPVAVTVQSAPVNVTFTFKPTALSAAGGAIVNAAFLGATVGAVLPVTMSVGTTTATPADIDTVSTSNVVTSVSGITATVLASNASNYVAGAAGTAVESKKIDVTTGAAIALTNPVAANTNTPASLLNFGAIRLTNNAVAKAADGVTAFTLAANYAGTYSAVLTGNFSAAQGTGGKVFLTSDAACAVSITVGSTATVTATTATFSGSTAPSSGVSQFVCMQINTPNNTVTIQPTTPSLVATIAGLSAATSSFSTTATSLYPLTNNGGAILVKSYIPASATGYTSYVRVINTGAVAAAINAAMVDQVTGVAGTSATIIATLAPGAASTLSSAQIEASVGAIATSANRPTLLITAPTNLKVQSFILTNANGVFSEVSGQETAQ